MIGIVIASHCDLSKSLIETAEFIVGVQKGILNVSINAEDCLDEIKTKIELAIQKVDTGDGSIILTDMLGGSPSIVSLSYMNKYNIEVVTGVNLPMILEVILHRNEFNLQRLAKLAVLKSKKSIVLAKLGLTRPKVS